MITVSVHWQSFTIDEKFPQFGRGKRRVELACLPRIGEDVLLVEGGLHLTGRVKGVGHMEDSIIPMVTLCTASLDVTDESECT